MISKVSSTLHTPLMSGANAIHGVILIGAILKAGSAQSTPILVLGLVVVILASINMVGGFVVTDRMLIMFSRPAGRWRNRYAESSTSDTGLGPARLPRGAICFIVALKGLSSVTAARRGNLIGAAGALLACVIVFVVSDLNHLLPILAAIAAGTAIGVLGAYRVQMTQMPQLVALFNGVGGGAAAIVAMIELTELTQARRRLRLDRHGLHDRGRLGQFRGLRGHLPQTARADDHAARGVPRIPDPVRAGIAGRGRSQRRPGPRPQHAVRAAAGGHRHRTGGAARAAGWWCRRTDRDLPPERIYRVDRSPPAAICSRTSCFGRGHWLASATLLTRLMANAMGRSLINILFGALKGGSTLGATTVSDRPVKAAGPADVAILLAYAQRVIIVPGYGLAVAQAQHTLRQLVDLLIERGVQVDYAIHPVAGRMPGHMNVLAEAQVPYEQLKEMDRSIRVQAG